MGSQALAAGHNSVRWPVEKAPFKRRETGRPRGSAPGFDGRAGTCFGLSPCSPCCSRSLRWRMTELALPPTSWAIALSGRAVSESSIVSHRRLSNCLEYPISNYLLRVPKMHFITNADTNNQSLNGGSSDGTLGECNQKIIADRGRK